MRNLQGFGLYIIPKVDMIELPLGTDALKVIIDYRTDLGDSFFFVG